MTNKRTDIETLLRELETQGCTIRRGKSGKAIIYPPSGEMTIVVHMTESDARSMNNTRSRCIRSGLTWPL